MLNLYKNLKNINIKFILIVNLILTTCVLLFWIIDKKIPPFGSYINKFVHSSVYQKKLPSSYKRNNELLNKINTFKSSLDINDNELIDPNEINDLFWANEIKKGGYILHFRHGEREKWDEALYGFDNYELVYKKDANKETWRRATCMTERGIETSKSIKRGFEHANIKIHKVFSSPSCRARETAIYAFGRIDEVHSSLLHYSTFNPLDRQKLAMDLKKTLLEFELDKDKNLILSSHNSVWDFATAQAGKGLVDESDIANLGLDETGFYIVENKNQKIILRYKFNESKTFLKLLYRISPESKKCPDPENPEINCLSM